MRGSHLNRALGYQEMSSMDVIKFKLSKKFILVALFSLVSFGIYSSLDLGSWLGNFNSIMEQSLSASKLDQYQTENVAILNARIQLLETQLEAQTRYKTMIEKIEDRVWVICGLFQFIFLLLVYKCFIYKEKT